MGLELTVSSRSSTTSARARATSRFLNWSRRCWRATLPVKAKRPIPGIVYRRGGESVYTGQAPLVRDMDALPYPDFSDYFENLMRDGESHGRPVAAARNLARLLVGREVALHLLRPQRAAPWDSAASRTGAPSARFCDLVRPVGCSHHPFRRQYPRHGLLQGNVAAARRRPAGTWICSTR